MKKRETVCDTGQPKSAENNHVRGVRRERNRASAFYYPGAVADLTKNLAQAIHNNDTTTPPMTGVENNTRHKFI